MNTCRTLVLSFVAPLSLLSTQAQFQAGAVALDVTPKQFPVLVNGGFLSRSADTVSDNLYARALALSDGKTEVVIVVVDSCMIPKDLLDKAKAIAADKTGIPAEQVLVSATHTHTAPSSFGALGTPADPRYSPFLARKVAEAIEAAHENLRPAKAGWHSVQAPEFTALRRWTLRPDRIGADPFGNHTVRATMHAGRNWDNATGETGPEDPELCLLAIRDTEDKPIAVLANFSMHYFAGMKALSADYFGLFCEQLAKRIPGVDEDFVGIMSHGCSGDVWRRDYTLRDWSKNPPSAKEQMKVDAYAEGLARRALQGFEKIAYRADIDLAMAELRLPLRYRVPDAQRLKWAAGINDARGERPPKNQQEVYAMEQVLLYEMKETKVVLQALRIGDMAITTTPNETYALTGLKLKARSPLPKTMVIELANGADGYIPPPEQHFLGGYNTWPARSAGLEIQAEPKITEACLRLLEQVAGKPRRVPEVSRGPTAEAIAALKPLHWWRFDEFEGPFAFDEQGLRDGIYENGVVFHLEGPNSKSFTPGQTNRAAHFAGGRMRSRLLDLGPSYSLSLHFWNGMPADSRPVLGWMFSRGNEHSLDAPGDHLGLDAKGRLLYRDGAETHRGITHVKRWTWRQAVLVREGEVVQVYLDGKLELEAKSKARPLAEDLFIGGRNDKQANWEGRLDEAAIFDRALTPAEIKKLTP